MNQNNFIKELKKINIELSEEQLNQLEKYYELLIEWNEKINLTNITEKDQVYLKHFYDSLTLAIISKDIINFNDNIKICDVGTGAGFPGMVLKIVFPNLEVTLVDSLNKRINFLNEIIKELNLKNIKAIHVRAEEFAKDKREYFDVVTARAVSQLSVLCEYCIPMVKVNGYFVAMKSNVEEEINKSKNILEKLDSNIETIKELYLPYENSLRNLVVIKKQKETNKKYPRKNSEIKKNK